MYIIYNYIYIYYIYIIYNYTYIYIYISMALPISQILPTGSQNNPKITHSVASHVSYFLS